MRNTISKVAMLLMLAGVVSCNNHHQKSAKQAHKQAVYRGLYSFGPEVKSFKDCDSGHEYWAADSSAKLELSYSQLHFEKPYTPVYVEIEGRKISSGDSGIRTEFDSTIVVTRLVKISREIPQNMCR